MTIESIQQELDKARTHLKQAEEELSKCKLATPHPMKGQKLDIRYKDGEHTWTGRGKTPNWLRDRMAEGATKEQFEVKP